MVYKESSASDKSGHVVRHEESHYDSAAEANLDPKIRKGLEKIRKLDAILADKLKVKCPYYLKLQLNSCLAILSWLPELESLFV